MSGQIVEQWPLKPLGELCTVVNGGTPKSKVSEYWGGDVNWVTPAEMGKMTTPYIDTTNRRITELGLQKSSAKLFPPHSVILSTRAPIGHLAINTSPMSTNQGCKTLIPNGELDYKYLYYFLYFNKELLDSLGTGATFKELSGKNLKGVEIPVPPLEEQQRIVSILDEAFNNISNSISQLEIRVQDAKELFLSSVENFFKNQDKTWEEPTLLELLERGWITSHLDGNHGGDYPRKSEFIDEGIRYISANCIRNETVDLTNSKFLSPERAAKLRKGIAQDGDVLFAHNATVGPVAILRTNESKIILGTSLTYYRCNPEYIISEYLAHYMRSYRFTKQYSQVMRQSTRNQVPITKQREFTHLIPPIELQSTMARKFDALQKETMELEKKYLHELTSYYELKQSILQEAFNGTL